MEMVFRNNLKLLSQYSNSAIYDKKVPNETVSHCRTCKLNDFSVFAYANASLIGSSMNVTVTGRDSVTLNFTWNTAGFAYGNYTVNVYAEPLQGEIDISDNNYTCVGSIHIGVQGDISGSTPGFDDGMVNMRDINYMILLFNTKPTSPNWNPNADVNDDGTVNMRDIQIANSTSTNTNRLLFIFSF